MSARIFLSLGRSREDAEGRSTIARARCAPKAHRSRLRTSGSIVAVLAPLAPWIPVTPPTSARTSAYRLWVRAGSLVSRTFCGSRTRAW